MSHVHVDNWWQTGSGKVHASIGGENERTSSIGLLACHLTCQHQHINVQCRHNFTLLAATIIIVIWILSVTPWSSNNVRHMIQCTWYMWTAVRLLQTLTDDTWFFYNIGLTESISRRKPRYNSSMPCHSGWSSNFPGLLYIALFIAV